MAELAFILQFASPERDTSKQVSLPLGFTCGGCETFARFRH